MVVIEYSVNRVPFTWAISEFFLPLGKTGEQKADEFKDAELIEKEDNITLNCGIGNAKTAREAVKLATKSLDTIREIRDSGKEKLNVYELSC